MIEEYNTQVNIFTKCLVTLITREGRVKCKIKDRLTHIWAFSILCQMLTFDVIALAHYQVVMGQPRNRNTQQKSKYINCQKLKPHEPSVTKIIPSLSQPRGNNTQRDS